MKGVILAVGTRSRLNPLTLVNNLPLIANQVIPIPSASYRTPAQRPGYSVLSNSRLARAFNCFSELCDSFTKYYQSWMVECIS